MGKTTRTDRECTNHGFIRGAHARQPVVHRSGSLGHGFIRGAQVSPWYTCTTTGGAQVRLGRPLIYPWCTGQSRYEQTTD